MELMAYFINITNATPSVVRTTFHLVICSEGNPDHGQRGEVGNQRCSVRRPECVRQ